MPEDSCIYRTVPIKLEISNQAEKTLRRTIDQFLPAINYVIDTAWDPEDEQFRTSNGYKLHEETYHEIRDRSALPADLVQNARKEAIERINEQQEGSQTPTKPRVTTRYLRYTPRSATINETHATLATIKDRVTAEFSLPEDPENTPFSRYLFNEAYEPAQITLHHRNNDWWLHVHCRRPRDTLPDFNPTIAGHQPILGVDLGVENIAVTSTGRFWTGDKLKHLRREFEKRRAALDQQGTRAARQTLQHVGRTEQRRLRQYQHRVANEIVEEAITYSAGTIAVEAIAGFRTTAWNRTMASRWAFNRLRTFIEYKAVEKGIDVVTVDPKHTSQRCSTCGASNPENRSDRSRFHCQQCGYQNHADYNAAKNIGLKALHRGQNGTDEGAPAGVRVNGGIVTTSGYTPVESESCDHV